MPDLGPIAVTAASLSLSACAPPAPVKPSLTPLLHTHGSALQPALSPDGTLLVTSDGEDLWLRPVGGEAAENLTADFTPAAVAPAFSPDGAHLAFTADGALYLAGPRGEEPRRLLEPAHDPAFSPDSARIAFVAEGGLWLTDLAGAAPVSVLRSHAPATPAFSPDGRSLAFAGEDPAGPGLFLVPLAGGEPRRLADGAVQALAWGPKDGALWYLARRGEVSVLLHQPPDRVEAVQVTVLPGGQGKALTIAAGTGTLVLSTARAETQIFAAPFDPSALKVAGPPVQITHSHDGARCPQPSPDGHGLAWVGGGAHQDLFLADPDGAHPRVLSTGEGAASAPHWMPDGAHLLFAGARQGRTGIWSFSLQDGGLRRLSGDSDPTVGLPLPSPDGKRLAVTGAGPYPFLIWLNVDWDIQVYAQAEGPGAGWTAAAWSPDGQRLALTDGHGGLALLDAASLAVTPLAAAGDWPLWTPDGLHLLVATDAGVGLVDFATSTTRPLLDVAPRRLAPPQPLALSPTGDRLYLALDLSEADLWRWEPSP